MMIIIFAIGVNVFAQSQNKPKLVVGIVVDQMRQEYLYRYNEHFSEGGFKRLMSEGFMLKNAHYNYIPTKTGPGHASIYTGTTPKDHGIILNEWYNPKTNAEINCVDDFEVQTVGSKSDKGEFSPRHLLAPTITDQLKLSTQSRSKVVSISIKNRGAILPGGHMPDGAYWYDGDNGNFVTSTYYADKLPSWVKKFNQRKLADQYLSGKWETLLPVEEYKASGPDDAPFEEIFQGSTKSVLPYHLSQWPEEEKYDLLLETPFGNTILKELALEAIINEEIGTHDETDFLAISFSSTDKVGHAFGPQSVEIQDTYLKLDRDLAEIFSKLDVQVGKGNYLVFLTADHAVAENPDFLKSKGMISGFYNEPQISKDLNQLLKNQFGFEGLVEHFSDGQLYLNDELIQSNKLNKTEVVTTSYDFLADLAEVSDILLAEDLRRLSFAEDQKAMVQRGYHWHRSGDITVLYQPTYIEHKEAGTTHGSGFTYDTHVPLLWYGWNIPQGYSYQYHAITEIAPTLAFLLDIKLPDAATGQPILEILK
ncbi:MAG: alkaline phosphatase PafA [Reichenbachiella sp.]|uniref:alkaline phosphatase PafA n=1 Tax=Reichenbachiella sp. TaxID=2184521 RepID=UPI002966E9F9|nr:alkaline phosphatase PafA [Reichenbachiella sp.]MDW3212197.1 alkaline phosphatase PafA [Reichenbachiella sp.]